MYRMPGSTRGKLRPVEINFTKYFYEFKPLRPLAEIKADILKLEKQVLA